MGNRQSEKKPTLRQQISKEVKMSLAFGIPNIVSYAGVLVDHSNYDPCTTSSESYKWAYVYWIYSIINTAISCIAIPFCMIQIDRMEKKNELNAVKKWKMMRGITKLVLLIGTFAVYFGICYAYSTGEECSHLTKLILSVIIIFPIVFVLIFALTTYRIIKNKKAEKAKLEVRNETGLLNNEENVRENQGKL